MGWIIGSFKRKRAALNDEIEKLQKNKLNLLNEIYACEKKIKRINDDLRTHKNELEKYEKKNVEAENEVRELKLSIIFLQHQKSLLLDENKKLEEGKKDVLPSIRKFERLWREQITLKSQNEQLNTDISELQKNYEKLQREYAAFQNNVNILRSEYINQYKSFVEWKNTENPSRLAHSFSDKIKVKNLYVEADVTSESTTEEYKTSLTSCTCPDFRFNTKREACKHMYALATRIGALGRECNIDGMKAANSEYEQKE